MMSPGLIVRLYPDRQNIPTLNDVSMSKNSLFLTIDGVNLEHISLSSKFKEI